jgi:pyridinium-3,5-bisthiocarboxylic acid mononucleotide nickel chelatase
MNTIYLDIFSGISGDMFIGALLDLGVDFAQFERELQKLKLDGYHLHAARGKKSSIEGVKFDVHLSHSHEHGHSHAHSHKPADHSHSHGHHEQHTHEGHEHSHAEDDAHEHEHGRTFSEIKELIRKSELSDWVKAKASAIFERVAVAEGKIHGQPPESVHFHEVGAVDSIIDIVGACVALEILGRPRISSGPLVEGSGWIDCAHGRFPIPAPATIEILARRKIPISQCEEPHELVTPTGAAILAELAENFGTFQGLTPLRVGYGLGTRDNKTRPNVLRAILCVPSPSPLNRERAGVRGENVATHDWETDTIVTLQTNLDDISSELLGRFMEQALAAGALDVFYTSIQMKKNRPGILLSVLCGNADADKFTEMILRETTAFGVRRFSTERRKLAREVRAVQTPYGQVDVKIGRLDGTPVQIAPEFDSCRELADRAHVPLKQVYEAAIKATQL